MCHTTHPCFGKGDRAIQQRSSWTCREREM